MPEGAKMVDREPMSETEQQVVDFVRDYRRRHGQGPTNEEGAGHFGWKQDWAFGYHVKNLIASGYLARGKGHRSLYVVGEADRGRKIHVYDEVSCGPPMPNDGAPEEIDLDRVFDPEEVFFVKARGDSMIDAQIRPGDFVAIKKGTEASWKSGDTVVIRIDGEITLKRIERRVDRSKGGPQFWLVPCNSKLAPFPLDPTKHNEIVGVYAGVVRLPAKNKK
jgi:repressor LexA